MTILNKTAVLLIVICLSLLFGMCRKDNDNRLTPSKETASEAALLMQLDSLLQNNGQFVKQKERKINQLREIFNTSLTDERKYWAASELYDEYAAYDSDSALHYTQVAMDYANRMGRQDLYVDMKLNRSYVLSATGLIADAAECLQSLDIDSLSPQLALKYCDRMVFLSSHRDQYMGGREATEHYAMLSDSLLNEIKRTVSPDNPQYGWFIGWSSLNSKKGIDEALKVVSKRLENADYSTRQNAKDAWMMSSLYDRKGDRKNRIKYLTLSAMADVRASNKEVASLQELASLMFDDNELDRANLYVNHSISNANDYKSRIRLGELASLQDKILSSIQQRTAHQSDVNRWFVVILAVIVVILLAGSVYVVRQNRRLQKSRQTLNHANDELNKRVEELSSTREDLNRANEKLSELYNQAADTARQLAEVNETKEGHIADVFTVCANYIDKLESFRANINKLLTTQKFDEAVKLTKSPELSYQEVRELWATFDNIFLNIYPAFVEDFNTLLKPEEQIELKKPGHLTNELRIYALVRLGMNDSQRIARFLHCSVQTVYNTRQKTRNKAIVPREQFVKSVMNLGKKDSEAG